ncbi:MAG TPA: Gfo/Idh/MocA family oxidoreductase [Candidatus Ruania gallistercoris]|uniref:Gfo/Idh/MocA family oxidoreductase n=1 Tax=Candidatus Ruania gallistercoris TaxID=2838746 RepID=A0A9D2J3R3_9MICO|nr:Gfo/Idh/MocA family oxidoreductase [Candidatus Ruania gallistercoris]
MTGPKPARAAIVGCGDISSIHVDALQRLEIPVVGVCDQVPERAEQVAATLGVPAFTDHTELLQRTSPDVVHVCTPHAEHLPVARDVLDGEAHLLVEKPLAATLAQAEELVAAAEAARRRGVRTGVVLQNRYNPPNRRLHELVHTGALGEVLAAKADVNWHRTADYYRARPWRGTWSGAGGGVMMNQAIHTLDLLLWLLGPAEEVRGHADTYALAEVIEVEDTAEFVISHASGARSTLFATNAYPLNAPVTVTVHATEATAVVSGDLTVTWTDGRTETVAPAVPGSVGRSYWGDSHRLLIEDFYARLEESEPFWIDPAAGLAPVAAIAAVYDASPGLAGRVPAAASLTRF